MQAISRSTGYRLPRLRRFLAITLPKTLPDPDHSADERRELIVGHNHKGKMLFVSFTERFESSVPDPQRERNEKTISKAKPAPPADEMRAEYSLDYSKAKPNRFASKLADTSVVVLQPDVAAVFKSSEAVNEFLRSAILATSKPRVATRVKATRKAA